MKRNGRNGKFPCRKNYFSAFGVFFRSYSGFVRCQIWHVYSQEWQFQERTMQYFFLFEARLKSIDEKHRCRNNSIYDNFYCRKLELIIFRPCSPERVPNDVIILYTWYLIMTSHLGWGGGGRGVCTESPVRNVHAHFLPVDTLVHIWNFY